MAGTIPTPRSYQSILGDMIDAFLSRYGLRGLKKGGPLLSILEAGAQSDLRSTQDIFNLLDATDIDRATGVALDRKAADEDLERLPTTQSSGAVDISDTSFAKISTKIYAGASAPNAGTSTLKIADASSFPNAGAIYIGRGTVNFEGPINYSAKSAVGTYWTLTLSTPTQKFHDVNEAVVLAKGGDRVIPAGTIVRTPQGNVANSVTFATVSAATIPDGEVSIAGVDVVCQVTGVIGNAPHGAIQEFTSAPFIGATVNNPLPFDNGLAAEDDESLRERIKAKRQSRSRGTPLALITNAKGVKAPDENKTVISASVFTAQGEPSVLFIDDGTGYEETNAGVAIESLLDQAIGGEQYFKLTAGSLPVSKAFVKTTLLAPFTLTGGATLAVKVAGVLTSHSFSESEFRSVANATAFEIVGSINGNPNLKFSARTSDNGTAVVLFARSELNEDVEVVKPDLGTDANTFLGFTSGVNYTLRLYKDDQLLYKDGRSAVLSTAPQTSWNQTIATGVYVKIKVDGTPAAVYKIVSQDFVDAATGYASVAASNSLTSWAAVFNARIPGITCSVASGRLQFVSNRGASNNAAIVISEPISTDKDTGGTTVVDSTNNLVQKGMFTAVDGLSATGRSNDYSLNRNTGDIKLTTPLSAGSALSAGTLYTQAYIQGDAIANGTVTFASTANLWLTVDSAATMVTTSVTSGTLFDLTAPAGSRRRYATNPSTAIFQNLKAGDWLVLWDPAFTVLGAWRVAYVDPAFTYFEVERANTHVNQTGVAPSSNGMVFCRTAANIQQLPLASGANRSLTSIVSELNGLMVGASASVFRNKQLRITTNTFGSNGDVMLIAADTEGQKLLLPRTKLVLNSSSHFAALEAGDREAGTPSFEIGSVTALPGGILGDTITVTGITKATLGFMIEFLRKTPVSGIGYGNNVNRWTPAISISGNDYGLRDNMNRAVVGDRVALVSSYSIGPNDNLTALLDEDAVSKSYNIPMWRKIKPVAGQSYTATNLQVLDADNSNVSLSTAFGTTDTNFFRDFALYMHARGKSHASSGGSAPANYHFNKAILWRYARMGAEGNPIHVQYTNPTAASQPITLATRTGVNPDLYISLPSDAARSGLSLFDTSRFTVGVINAAGVDTVTYSFSRPTVSLQRVSNVVTGTTTGNHGFNPGDVVYVTSGDVNFPSGAKTVVTTATATTFTYNEAAADAGPSAGQTVSSASADPNFASVLVGDIVSIGTTSGFSAGNTGAFRVTAKTATTFTIKQLAGSAVGQSTPVSIKSAANISFFPIKTADSTATKIALWVNANIPSVATAVVVENGGGSPGAGIIDMATVDEFIANYGNSTGGVSVKSWLLQDGINLILSSNLGAAPNTVTMKFGVASDLISNSDFDNEEFKLVPITAKAIARYLASPAVSGFYAGSQEAVSSGASKLQLNSLTNGSAGSIQVTGGLANAAGAAILGAGDVVDTSYSKVTILDSQSNGFTGAQFVAAQGSNSQVKAVPITGASALQTIAASGDNWLITFDGGTVLWSRQQVINDVADSWQIDKVGRFAAYTLIDGGGANTIVSGVGEGSWVKIKLSNANPANTGTFRVVRKISNTLFWIENPNAVDEYVAVGASDFVEFYPYDAVMPGDKLVLDTAIFGAQNRGTFTVVDTTGTGSGSQIIVSGSMIAFGSGGALGGNSAYVRVLEAAPIRLIKQIQSINRTPGSTVNVDLVFDTSALAAKLSSGAGVSIQALDKLAFDTSIVAGADAYSYAKGLIGEVNKVIYGDATNPSVYPGVVAAGAQVNVSGPLIKRIAVSLAIRIRGTPEDVIDRVKSSVASAINRIGIGQNVPISNIVTAASGVDGVVAVTILSPAYGAGNDLIPVQANEKPRVLNIDQDVLVSVVGA